MSSTDRPIRPAPKISPSAEYKIDGPADDRRLPGA
jgi:hypothetical protein